MPCGDGTGPWWAQKRNWNCRSTFGRGYGFRWQMMSTIQPILFTKDQQKNLFEEALKELETEKQEIEKRLKELQEKKQ
jgi:predicted nucleotide-binding protein (sugar kinase/HSP70/actin superfamily)